MINIRPRPRPPERRHPRRRLALRGRQHTSGTLGLSVVSGDLTLGGAQRTTGSACLTALLGTQRTTGALLPDIILPGRQRTTGLLTFDRPANTYPNGYLYMLRVAAGPQPDLAPATLTDFPAQLDTARVDADWTWLKSTSGKLLSVSGGVLRDVRLELEDGTKLDHYTVLWDASAGRAVWRIRFPSWLTSGRHVVCVYYGKPGLSSSEENVPGAFRACMAARHPLTGIDLSGNGRHLTMSGVTSALVNGLPGGAYGVNAYGRLASPAYLNGLGGLGLSVELPINVGSPLPASGSGYRVGGAVAGTGDWVLWQDSDAGGAWWSGGWGDNTGKNYARSTDPGTAVAGLVLLGLEVQSEQDPALYLTGERKDTRVNNGAVLTGTTEVTAADTEAVGAPGGSISNPTALPGVYGLLLTYPRKLGPTWWACMARCQMDPASFWGAGSEDAPADADRSPVALPVRATITDAGDIDAVSAAYDPDGGGGLSLVSPLPGQPSHGTASILTGKIHYQRAGTYTGADQGPFSIKDAAGKVGRARYSLTVLGGTPPSGELPWTSPPGTTRLVPEQYATIQAALDAANAGDEISVADGNRAGFTAARGGVSGRPILIRSRSDPRQTGRLGVTITSAVTLQAPWVYLWGVDTGINRIFLKATDCRLWRFKTLLNSGAGSGGQINVTQPRCFIGYGDQSQVNIAGRLITVDCSAGSSGKQAMVWRMWLHDSHPPAGNVAELVNFGTDPTTTAVLCASIFRDSRVENYTASHGEEEALSMKSRGNWVYRVTLVAARFLSARHGGPAGGFGPESNIIEECYCDRAGAADPCGIEARDGWGKVLNCKGVNGAELDIKKGDITVAGWQADPGHQKKVRAENWLVANPEFPTLEIGEGPSALNLPALNTRVEANRGPAPKLTLSQGQQIVGTSSVPYLAPPIITAAQVGPFATWQGWPSLARG